MTALVPVAFFVCLFAVSETGPCILGWLQAISYAAEMLLSLPTVLGSQTDPPGDLPGAGDGTKSFIPARCTLLNELHPSFHTKTPYQLFVSTHLCH
jgi:hypothetical protein